MYSVKALADLAGVSRRTLHYYDEIGLLKPTTVQANGYRVYDEAALLRLQQILFYRELDFELEQIKALLDEPDFDLVSALREHRSALEQRQQRLKTLTETIDSTIMHLVGEVKMDDKNAFRGFSEEQQKEYEQQAREEYGAENVDASIKRWNSYSTDEQQRIMEEGGKNYTEIAANMDRGPESEEVQELLVRWHQHLHYFYVPSLDILRGLGDMYNEHPDFKATFTAIDPDLPPFLQKAINHYVDQLEYAWLRRELGLLEE
jgi:DNA-binding transcriptional MerR regulator